MRFPWVHCILAVLALVVPVHGQDDPIVLHPHPFVNTPDWAEVPGALPSVSTLAPAAFGPAAPSERQPPGAMSGRIVFMNSGHGWTWHSSLGWWLQRGTGNEMNEDYGNNAQLNFFATYCFNAGATVVSVRPLGQQTNEVVLDNDDASVDFAGTWFDSTLTIRKSFT